MLSNILLWIWRQISLWKHRPKYLGTYYRYTIPSHIYFIVYFSLAIALCDYTFPLANCLSWRVKYAKHAVETRYPPMGWACPTAASNPADTMTKLQDGKTLTEMMGRLGLKIIRGRAEVGPKLAQLNASAEGRY